jgi:type IV pilus assembly protein PilX
MKPRPTIQPTHSLARERQRGLALIFSMMILVVLTILGVSAMRTSALQQLMASNTQETMRAFQAADSGLDRGMNQIKTSTPADPGSFANNTQYSFTDMKATSKAQTPTLLQIGPPTRSSKGTGYSTAARAYYNQRVIGTTPVNAQVVLHQGITTGAPTNPYSP